MNTQSNSIKYVVIFLVLSVLMAAFGTGTVSQAKGITGPNQPAPAPAGKAVALEALVGQSSGRTINLTKVYQQPDSSSIVVYVLQPTSQVNLVGRSEDGDWYAVAGDQSDQGASGWIAITDLSVAKVTAEVRSLAKVYQRADSSSQVVSVLAPSQRIEVLGRAAGSNWLAIRNQVGGRNSVAYVSRADVQIERDATGTYSPVKTYLRPNQISFVIDILVPNQKVSVIGRSADGRWLAVENAETGQFRGWVWASELRNADQYADVPVLPVQ